jgi:hypothetical protein
MLKNFEITEQSRDLEAAKRAGILYLKRVGVEIPQNDWRYSVIENGFITLNYYDRPAKEHVTEVVELSLFNKRVLEELIMLVTT